MRECLGLKQSIASACSTLDFTLHIVINRTAQSYTKHLNLERSVRKFVEVLIHLQVTNHSHRVLGATVVL